MSRPREHRAGSPENDARVPAAVCAVLLVFGCGCGGARAPSSGMRGYDEPRDWAAVDSRRGDAFVADRGATTTENEAERTFAKMSEVARAQRTESAGRPGLQASRARSESAAQPTAREAAVASPETAAATETVMETESRADAAVEPASRRRTDSGLAIVLTLGGLARFSDSIPLSEGDGRIQAENPQVVLPLGLGLTRLWAPGQDRYRLGIESNFRVALGHGDGAQSNYFGHVSGEGALVSLLVNAAIVGGVDLSFMRLEAGIGAMVGSTHLPAIEGSAQHAHPMLRLGLTRLTRSGKTFRFAWEAYPGSVSVHLFVLDLTFWRKQ